MEQWENGAENRRSQDTVKRRRKDLRHTSRVRNTIAVSLMAGLTLIATVLILLVGRNRGGQVSGEISTELPVTETAPVSSAFTTYEVAPLPETEDRVAEARAAQNAEAEAAASAEKVKREEEEKEREKKIIEEEEKKKEEERRESRRSSIVYDPNGGNGEEIAVPCAPGADAVADACLFYRPGFVFSGWSRQKEGGQERIAPMQKVHVDGESETRLYAQWIPAADTALTITGIDVSESSGRVDFSGAVDSDNGRYRLYVIGGGAEVLSAEVTAASSGTIVFAGENLITSHFVIRALRNGEEVNISEVLPLYSIYDTDVGLQDPSRVRIKGILPHGTAIQTGALAQLQVRQVIYNLYLADFLDPKGGNTVPFAFNGKEYAFSEKAALEYDHLISEFAALGLEVTMVLINDRSGANPLIHQTAGGVNTTMYMLATTPEAIELECAMGAFLASRYSYIRNWIIGNEIDAWYQWNYMNASGISEYVAEYSKGFRAFHAGISSVNGNARVYLSLTQNWTGDFRGQYRGRDVLDQFAAMNRDIWWHLAYHPYGWPMTDATAWDSPNTSMSFDTRTITLENISVLTSYMGLKRFRQPDGSRKSIILSEFGYTSLYGNEVNQAASIVYAYRQALKNPYIDAFLLAREMDEGVELAQGLATGLKNQDGSGKLAWSWYAAMGTDQEQAVLEEAYRHIGQ